jgi:hypothetical protein
MRQAGFAHQAGHFFQRRVLKDAPDLHQDIGAI